MFSALEVDSLLSELPGKAKNNGVVSLSLLQGIFPTEGLNPGLLHCKWFFYQLSHQGSPRILSLLQRIFPTQESNWGLQHCRLILYQLSYQGLWWDQGQP